MAMSFGHIYLGTIGMEGSYESMRFGYVDETWAKEHHEHWYNDVKSGKIYASVALQFAADMVQSFNTLTAMMADPAKAGQQLTVPQKVITAGS